jgi:hypothetical protein
MKKNIFYLIAFFFLASCSSEQLTFTSDNFQIEINNKGQITSFFDSRNKTEYFPDNQESYLLSLRSEGVIIHPDQLEWDENNTLLKLIFNKNNIVVKIKVEQKQLCTTFELVTIEGNAQPDLAIWGPFATTINQTVGETVGVVRNNQFAIGIQALNPKTLGGYPTNEDDTEPAYDIFASNNLVDVGDSVKVLYRGQTAKHTEFGSVIQAYCRNRSDDRVIPVWNHEYYEVPAFEDGGLIGTKIALFGCESSKALETIGKIEIAEGLPHPEIDGEWAKTAHTATASYLIIGFSEDNLDQAIQLTKDAGLKYLYHGGPFTTWGHFMLNENSFPDGWESMKNCVERANEQGIKLGVHTLSNFITTNDAYVTPTPDKRLAKVGGSVLTNDVTASSAEIFIESPMFFNQMKNNSLHSVVIGNEIIRYKEVSETAPWKLTGCVRGAFNTQATAHKKGEVIGKLMDHGYKVFLSNAELSEEIAKNIAQLYNETGLLQISFDGLEGVWSTGMGQYARNLFTKTWFDNLNSELKGKVINDASNPSHYNWHINTRYNWGEPWYAGFRESQTNYRLMNQDYYRRNLLPSMLGWFSMSDQTSIEDAEWLLARAAGFDAGFAFNVNLGNVFKNGQSKAIFEAIKQWETARMAGAFTPEQKLRMENINNEFHLERLETGGWNLFPFKIERYVYEQKIRQPGEPMFSSFEFNNPYEEQPIMFLLNLIPGESGPGSTVNSISIKINNSQNLKIPIKMKPFQTLKLDQSGKLQLFDKNWNLIQTIIVQDKIPTISKNKNTIIFDTDFSSDGASKFKIEIKTLGSPEHVVGRL